MEDKVIQAKCHTKDFLAVEEELRSWEEVKAVGSFREKQNNKKDVTTVFVTLLDEEAVKKVEEKLARIPGIIKDEETDAKTGSKPTQKKNKNLAAEFIKYESYADPKPSHDAHRGAERSNGEHHNNRRGRGGRGGRGGERGAGGANRGRGGRGRGNQARGRGGNNNNNNNNNNNGNNNNNNYNHQHNNNNNGNYGNRRQYMQRSPLMEANVAFVDNVPFGATNSHLMDIFGKFGRILDINRLELMAMVCYDNPESVQQCIQHVNGTKINENTVTVSSGTVRIPANAIGYMRS